MTGSDTEPVGETGGFRLYTEYIAEQLANQELRKKSLEDRGRSITTSGALATILLGLVSFASKEGSIEIGGDARRAVVVALVLFVVAAVLALLTNVPLFYRRPLEGNLRNMIETRWTDTEATAAEAISRNRVTLLISAGTLNSRKAWTLLFAMTAEVLAIALIAVAVAIIL